MSNTFGPKKPLFGPYTYRVKRNVNDDTLIAVYHGSKRIAHMDAYWAYSMRSIEEHEEEEARRGKGKRLVCATDLRALGAEGRYPNVLRVGHAFVDDEAYKGKGIGRAMYEAMMAEGFAVRETRVGGYPGPMFLIPDECGGAGNTSADALRVWASLGRDYPSAGVVIRVDAPPVVGSRAKANPRRRRRNATSLEGLLRIVDTFQGEPLYGRAEREFSDLLTSEGYEVVGSGGARIVVALGPDLVAKIDMDPDAVANNSEQDFYRWNKDNTDLLSPVLSAHLDGRVLVMPRAERVFNKGVPKKYRREVDAAREEISALPYAYDRVDHEHDFNYGLVNGVVQLLDYNT